MMLEVFVDIPDINCKKFNAVLSADKTLFEGPLTIATKEFFINLSPSLNFHWIFILGST